MILPLIEHIENLFKTNTKFTDKDGKLFVPKILEAIDKIESDLIKLLMGDAKAKEQFFVKIDDVYVLKQNDLIEFFTMNEYFNHSFTSYTNKIGLIKKDNFVKKFDDVVLAFPYKDCVLEGGQTKDDEKNSEVFYNSIVSRDEIDRLLEPKVLTNIKRFDKDGEHEVEEIKEDDNLIIKGNNLLALHSLKKRYAGKVKLIYIDPPYNTGGDSFGYNDSFNHSTWLTFMKNRLEVAREFLSEDGVIFVSLNDVEVHYLKILLDEIFARENFIANVIWHSKYTTSNDAKYVSYQHENILFYSKNKSLFNIGLLDRTDKQNKNYKNRDNDPKGAWKATPLHAKSGTEETNFTITFKNGLKWEPPKGRFHTYSKETLHRLDENNELYFNKNGGVDKKTYLSKVKNGITVGSVWSYEDVGHTHSNNEELAELLGKGAFNNPKGIKLIKQIIKVANLSENDIVLDFFGGSGTTAHATLEYNLENKTNYKFLMLEQMDYIENITIERVKKVLEKNNQGDFVYAELKAIDNFSNSPIAQLNKNMQYLPISEIEDEEYAINEKEIAINKQFYGVEDE